jgi:RNA polymerase II subunit A-like phosphatase
VTACTRSAALSADFTGFSAKDLKRLFPTDQSMVVIIDDRSDIWSDVPNLVKVVPCELPTAPGS